MSYPPSTMSFRKTTFPITNLPSTNSLLTILYPSPPNPIQIYCPNHPHSPPLAAAGIRRRGRIHNSIQNRLKRTMSVSLLIPEASYLQSSIDAGERKPFLSSRTMSVLFVSNSIVSCNEIELRFEFESVDALGVREGDGDTLTTEMEEEEVGESSTTSEEGIKKSKRLKSGVKLFGVDLTPDNIAVAMVYFVQGVLGLARLAVSFYLKDDLHLDPAETAVITGFSALPWLVKPLYGFISDSIPLFGYRRRSYLVLCGLLGAFSWSLMATVVDSKYDAAFCILLGSLSVAFSDVVVDSMVVERARGESQSMSGSLQSLCWGSSAFGGIVSAYFSGSLVASYGVRFVFGVTSLLPLITSAVAVLVREKPVSRLAKRQNLPGISVGFYESSRQNLIELWKAVKQPNVFLPTLFIFLWQATPQSDSAMFYFTTNQLGFTPEFLGRVKLVTSVASLAGVGLYNGFLKNVPLRKIFLATTIFGTALGMTQVILVTGLNRDLGISDEWFAIGDSLILTVLGQASFMPVLVLAARLCPEGMEATLFATLMSISNGGSVLGGLIGAGLTQLFGVTKAHFDNLAYLIIFCNLTSLLPLPLLGLLPNDSPDFSSKPVEEVDIEMKSN